MPVVHVMRVGVPVAQGLVPVPMRVRYLLQLPGPVLVLVVLVVLVLMCVFSRFVSVFVLVDVGA